MANYEYQEIMGGEDRDPCSISYLISAFDCFEDELMRVVDRKINKQITETLTEKPIEDMITDKMIIRIVERVFAMLDPMVREQITGMGEKIEEKLIANVCAPREMEGEQWSTILRRLADILDVDEQSQT